MTNEIVKYHEMTPAYLRMKNLERMKVQFPECQNWDELDWYGALVGEIGEYANFRKKFIRGSISEKDFLVNAGKELADVQLYLDLLAAYMGISGLASITGLPDYTNEVFSLCSSDFRSGREDLPIVYVLSSNKGKNKNTLDFRRAPSPEELLASLDMCKTGILLSTSYTRNMTDCVRIFNVTQNCLEQLAYSLKIDLVKEVVNKFNETSMKMPEDLRVLMELK
ncbi:MAG: MazG-like family protein [Balneolaceae bacterium]